MIPAAVTEIYRVFADRTWCGTVKDVSVKTVMVQEGLSKGERDGTYMKNNVYRDVKILKPAAFSLYRLFLSLVFYRLFFQK